MALKIPGYKSEESRLRELASFKVDAAIGLARILPEKVRNLLIDQEILFATFEGLKGRFGERLVDIYDYSETTETYKADLAKSFSDYSFIISPACKAFEGYLLFLAEKFNLGLTESELNRVGGAFLMSSNEKLNAKILSGLEKIMGEDREGMTLWKSLGGILTIFRHDPMHFNGEVDTVQRARNMRGQFESIIDQTLEYFVDKGYLEGI